MEFEAACSDAIAETQSKLCHAQSAHRLQAWSLSSWRVFQQLFASSSVARHLQRWSPCSRHPLQAGHAIFWSYALTPNEKPPCSWSLDTLHTTHTHLLRPLRRGSSASGSIWQLAAANCTTLFTKQAYSWCTRCEITWELKPQLVVIRISDICFEVHHRPRHKLSHEGGLSAPRVDAGLIERFIPLFLTHAGATSRTRHTSRPC